MTITYYRTYSNCPSQNFKPIDGSFCNKPRGGLWGCKGTEWVSWCISEEFPCPEHYFVWKFKDEVKIFTIDTEYDFLYLLEVYPLWDTTMDKVISIDYMKLQKDYDAVELTTKGNNLMHHGINMSFSPKTLYAAKILNDDKYSLAKMLGVNSWDVPSICVFNPKETVEIVNFNRRT